MPEYQFLFHNTRGAIRFEDTLKEKKIVYRIMPPPIQIQNCCGISIRVENEENIDNLINPDIKEIHIVKDINKYELYYKDKVTKYK